MAISLLALSSGLVANGLRPVGQVATPTRVQSVAMSATADPARKKIPAKQAWVTWLEAKEVKPGTVTSALRYGQEIAVACDPGGKLYALSNKMPPTGQPATFATFGDKGTILEPITQTAFSLKSGKLVGKWCPGPPVVGQVFALLTSPADIPTYPVRKQGNTIQVQVNVNAKAQFEADYWRGVLDAQGKVDGGYY